MTEHVLKFPIDIGDVLDVDLRCSPGSDPMLASTADLISIQGFGKRQVLICPEGTVELPESWPCPEYPHLRWLGPNRLLLIDTSSELVNGENAFIIDERGRLLSHFHLGPGVIDVVTIPGTSPGVFAVAYHADAAHEFGLEAGPLANTAVSLFDFSGRMVASFNGDIEASGWHAANVQCVTARDSGELVIIPEFLRGPKEELGSPILFYDWRSGRWRMSQSSYSRPLALSSQGTRLLVYSPEENEDELVECDLRGRKTRSLGFRQHIYRGLSGGRFLAQLSGVEYHLFQATPETGESVVREPIQPTRFARPTP